MYAVLQVDTQYEEAVFRKIHDRSLPLRIYRPESVPEDLTVSFSVSFFTTENKLVWPKQP